MALFSCTTLGTFVTKHYRTPADEPDAPKNLKATDWDKDHVDLKWEPPVSDGGSPITGYLVEKKDKYGNWEKALEVRLPPRNLLPMYNVKLRCSYVTVHSRLCSGCCLLARCLLSPEERKSNRADLCAVLRRCQPTS